MTKIAIVSLPFSNNVKSNLNYRGLYRNERPDYPDDPYKMSKIQEAEDKYWNNIDLSAKEIQYLDDYKLAREIASIYTKNNEKGEVFEVIEITFPNEDPEFNENFLGYDVIVTNEGISVIENFISLINVAAKNLEWFDYFNTKLNKYILFDDLDVTKELEHEAKKLLDDNFKYQIIGIYAA